MMTAIQGLHCTSVCSAVIGTVLVIGPAELRRPVAGRGAHRGRRAQVRMRRSSPPAESRVESKAGNEGRTRRSEAKDRGRRSMPKPQLAAAAPPGPVSSADAGRRRAKGRGVLAESAEAGRRRARPISRLVKPPAPAADAWPVRASTSRRIDDRGEAAVIAGQRCPGCQSRAAARRQAARYRGDGGCFAGQFVMTPPQLPAGAYELTLRAQAPDGTLTQSVAHHARHHRGGRPAAGAHSAAKQEATSGAETGQQAGRQIRMSSPRCRPQLAEDLASSVPTSRRPGRVMTGAPKPKAMAGMRRTPPTAVASASPVEIFSATSQQPADGGSRVIAQAATACGPSAASPMATAPATP